jgi:ABC-type Fe3+-siderophore transport system permease subunit
MRTRLSRILVGIAALAALGLGGAALANATSKPATAPAATATQAPANEPAGAETPDGAQQ